MVGAQSEQDEREASRIVHRVKGRWFNESKNRFPWEGCLSRKDRKHTLGCTFSLLHRPSPISAAAAAAAAALLDALTTIAAEHLVVLVPDGLNRRHERLPVDCNHSKKREELRLHVRVGQVALAREDLLAVALVRQVAGCALEHGEMERERKNCCHME